jgi:Transposase DDE domain
MLSEIFGLWQKREPVLMMVWALLENTLSPEFINDIFSRGAVRQYTRTLLFSDIVHLMSAVVTGVQTSIHSAFKKSVREKRVSLTAHYDKLNGIELGTCILFVREVGIRLKAIIEKLGGVLPACVPGYNTRIIDGNALGGTQHRIKALRNVRSAPLPGKSLVVLDPDYEIAVETIPCEDGHAQERSLFDKLLELVCAGEVWIADRNFCTIGFLFGIVERGAAFLIRQHAGLPWEEFTPLIFEPGKMIAEHQVAVFREKQNILVRRIVVRLEKATRDGDFELSLLTTIPHSVLDAVGIAERYRNRWRLETFFHTLTVTLRCEVKTFCYPKAALFAFAVALIAGNIVATVRAAIRAVHTRTEEEKLSNFHLVQDVQNRWELFERTIAIVLHGENPVMDQASLIAFLLSCAKNIQLDVYRKAPNRGHRTKKTRGTSEDPPHVSTARLLAEAKQLSVVT